MKWLVTVKAALDSDYLYFIRQGSLLPIVETLTNKAGNELILRVVHSSQMPCQPGDPETHQDPSCSHHTGCWTAQWLLASPPGHTRFYAESLSTLPWLPGVTSQSPPLKAPVVSLGRYKLNMWTMRGVNLKQIDGQVFLQQGWVYPGYQQRISIRAVQPWWAACKSPHSKGRRTFIGRKRDLEGPL